MDVLVKISRYFGLWLLNPKYRILSIVAEFGERIVIVHESRIEGQTVWLEVANSKDNSIVRIEKAESLHKSGTVSIAEEIVLKLDPEAMVD